MAICSKCKTGFDSNLGRCPKCNSIYDPRAKKVNWSFTTNFTNFSFFFFLGIWLLAIGLPLLAVVLFQFTNDRFSSNTSIFESISVVDAAIVTLYIGIICWSYADANKRGKPGILVAFLIAIAPIFGLLLWLIFRPSIDS